MVVAAVGVAAIGASFTKRGPWVVGNASASVPIGLYRIDDSAPNRGYLALVKLPPGISRLANHRGYLLTSAHLLKHVAATEGDRVCGVGRIVFVNRRVVARAATNDALGRRLPNWQGCRVLKAGQLFLLSTAANSFDSRYFGPIDIGRVIGRALPVWTLQ